LPKWVEMIFAHAGVVRNIKSVMVLNAK
jgi:hypothetical protein